MGLDLSTITDLNQLFERTSNVSFSEAFYTQDKLRLWPHLQSTPASQFLTYNSAPNHGDSDDEMVQVILAQLGERLRYDFKDGFIDD